MWVLDYREEVESDFSALHRVDDFTAMPARRFFTLAGKLSAYPGAVSAALATSSTTPPVLELASENLEYPGALETRAMLESDADTPPDVVARMRLGLLSELHGGRPMDWVDHDTLVREAQK